MVLAAVAFEVVSVPPVKLKNELVAAAVLLVTSNWSTNRLPALRVSVPLPAAPTLSTAVPAALVTNKLPPATFTTLLRPSALSLTVRTLASTVPLLATVKTLPVAPPLPTVMLAPPALASHTPPVETVRLLFDEPLPIIAVLVLTKAPPLVTSKVADPAPPGPPMVRVFCATHVEPAPVTLAVLVLPLVALRLTAPVLLTTPPLITTNVPRLLKVLLSVQVAPALLTTPPAWLTSGALNTLDPVVPAIRPPLALVNRAAWRVPPLRRITPVLRNEIRLPLVS